MAARCYSETFCRNPGVAGAVYYWVPAGLRAVLRNLIVINYADVAGYVNVQVGGTCVSLVLFPGPTRNVSLDLRAVAYTGQQIYALSSVNGLHVVCSGFIFEDPSGAHGPPAAALPRPEPKPPEPPGV